MPVVRLERSVTLIAHDDCFPNPKNIDDDVAYMRKVPFDDTVRAEIDNSMYDVEAHEVAHLTLKIDGKDAATWNAGDAMFYDIAAEAPIPDLQAWLDAKLAPPIPSDPLAAAQAALVEAMAAKTAASAQRGAAQQQVAALLEVERAAHKRLKEAEQAFSLEVAAAAGRVAQAAE